MHLDLDALNHHGYIGGAPGSGKTSLLRLLIQGFPGPIIALDTKGSPELADTVWGLPGHVWQIGGPLRLDLLDPEPAILAQQLLEGETFTDRAAVYRAIAEHAVQRAAWVLRWRDEPREPARILELLSSPADLAVAIRASMPPNLAMAQRWLAELDTASATMREAFQTFGERLGTLLDSPAGRSLGAGSDALRLADVLVSNGKLLIQLDPRYGAIARKLGAWTLVAMLRLAAELRSARWQGRCLFLIDEPRLLGHEGRHLADLFGTARDAGLGLVVADWGIAGLAAVDPDLPDAIMRSTGWQLVLRQGSAADAEQIAAQFGTVWREDVSRSSDGRTTTRMRQEPRVYPSILLGLPRGSGLLRRAAIGPNDQERVDRVEFAMPAAPTAPPRLALPSGEGVPRGTDGTASGTPDGTAAAADAEFESDNDASNSGCPRNVVIGGTPRSTEPDLSSVEGQKRAVFALVKVIEGWRRWRGAFDYEGWPRWGRQAPYRMIYEWEHEDAIPPKWTIDHTCGEKDCLDHLEAVTVGENTRRRHARARGELPIGHVGLVPPGAADDAPQGAAPEEQDETGQDLTVEERRAEVQRLRAEGWSVRRIAETLRVGRSTVDRDARATITVTATVAGGTPAASEFAFALFAGIDRPVVEQRTVSLDELCQVLSRFEVLDDKRRGRCWSPTRYADGARSRSNAGVAEVSALVFDLDRIPPDPERLAGVYWLGHTTWSHRPEAPRWRVVVPLAEPVPAASWGDVWRRARAALCPEADPSCKDPSRQYYLPAHSGGVTAKASCHDGPLLDPSALPELPAEEHAELRRSPSTKNPRKTTGADHRRGDDYMAGVVRNLATAGPGGRNAALNGAAWTLGRWIAAGALEQSDAEDALYGAAEANGLVADDGKRQCWATIRSGQSAGLQEPIDLDADQRPRRTS